jgi:hypothetical protein
MLFEDIVSASSTAWSRRLTSSSLIGEATLHSNQSSRKVMDSKTMFSRR